MLVQDLCLTNEAVVTPHPVVPNPYTVLDQIPPDTLNFHFVGLQSPLFPGTYSSF
jgi:hypothetical protein